MKRISATGDRSICSRVAGVVLALMMAAPVAAQHIDELEFINAPVRDILVSLGGATGNAVVPDDTVAGTASLYFSDTDFRSALELIAAQFGLAVTAENSVHRVSAISVDQNTGGSLSVHASDVPLDALLHRISAVCGSPVVFDQIPSRRVTYHTADSPLETVLRHLAVHLPGYVLTPIDDGFAFLPDHAAGAWYASGQTSAATPFPADESNAIRITTDGGLFAAEVRGASFQESLAELFATGGHEYQLLARGNAQVTSFTFRDKSFDELVTLLCERSDARHTVVNGVYYIADASPLLALTRTRETAVIRPEYLRVASIVDLLPAEQVADATLRPDRYGETLSVTGPPEVVNRIVSLVAAMDQPPEGREYVRISLSSIQVGSLPALLPAHLSVVPLTPLPDGASCLALATSEQARDLRAWLALVDRPVDTTAMELMHISVPDLLAHLPPSVTQHNIVPTSDDRRFFFRGTDTERESFVRELASLDIPPPQIRYQILVVQYEDGVARDHSFDFSGAVADAESVQSFLGSVGDLLSLNFNVIAAFGLEFAARLSAQVENSEATILADTTLNALSGQSVRFQSTNTYRYRDTVSGSTDSPAATVIRELTSGLVLETTGWVSGNGDVTIDVSATVSKQGSDDSNGVPPRTSEKAVSTQVRTTSGNPVVVTGLIQQEAQDAVSGVPLLSRIPFLGWLFRQTNRSHENTELAIYIIPYAEASMAEPSLNERLLRLYDRITEDAR